MFLWVDLFCDIFWWRYGVTGKTYAHIKYCNVFILPQLEYCSTVCRSVQTGKLLVLQKGQLQWYLMRQPEKQQSLTGTSWSGWRLITEFIIWRPKWYAKHWMGWNSKLWSTCMPSLQIISWGSIDILTIPLSITQLADIYTILKICLLQIGITSQRGLEKADHYNHLKLHSLFAALHFWTFHTKSHNMKALVILSHSWSQCLPLTCLYGKNELLWVSVQPSEVFSWDKTPPRLPMQIPWPWTPVGSFRHGLITVRQKKMWT